MRERFRERMAMRRTTRWSVCHPRKKLCRQWPWWLMGRRGAREGREKRLAPSRVMVSITVAEWMWTRFPSTFKGGCGGSGGTRGGAN